MKFKWLVKTDDEIYHESMQNAYILLTQQISFDELIDYNGCNLPFHPRKKISKKIYSSLINYFCELEEYEKCAQLKSVMDSDNYDKNLLNL